MCPVFGEVVVTKEKDRQIARLIHFLDSSKFNAESSSRW